MAKETVIARGKVKAITESSTTIRAMIGYRASFTHYWDGDIESKLWSLKGKEVEIIAREVSE